MFNWFKKKKISKYENNRFDPDGSYTGTRVPEEGWESLDDITPVQDVDDL